MFVKSLGDNVVDVIAKKGPIRVKDILEELGLHADKREAVNSLLYGELRSVVIRDKDETGMHTWRLKGNSFEAARGLEVKFYTELVKKKIISSENSTIEYTIEHPRKKKVYHLDIAVVEGGRKFDIEIDGYEHMRADAMLSIQMQLAKKGKNDEIEIDWMDHERSYGNFEQIDKQTVYRWCSSHVDWCIRYHEELLWPHDITRNMWLIENGWQVMRFWNFEIKNDMDTCLKQVREVLRG